MCHLSRAFPGSVEDSFVGLLQTEILQSNDWSLLGNIHKIYVINTYWLLDEIAPARCHCHSIVITVLVVVMSCLEEWVSWLICTTKLPGRRTSCHDPVEEGNWWAIVFYIIDTDVATVLPSRRSILARGRGSQSSWHGRGRGWGDDQGVEKELEPFSQLTTLKRFNVASKETESYSQLEPKSFSGINQKSTDHN